MEYNNRSIVMYAILALPALQYATAQTSSARSAEAVIPVVAVRSPIAPGVFHLMIKRRANSAPPASPFVAAPGDSVLPPVGDRSPGTITGNPEDPIHPLVLRSLRARLSSLRTIASNGISTIFTFTHDAQDRFYGNGNESKNHAGPLVHIAGRQMVNNGTTCLPFIWSPSGYGILIANNLHDVKSHTTWSDLDGI